MTILNWKFPVSLSILGCVISATDVQAASFRLRENNASGIGYAMAGMAAAPEGKPAEQFDNVASLGFMEKSAVQASAIYLRTNAKFTQRSAKNPVSAGGAAINTGNGGNAGGNFVIPAAYFAHKLSKSWVVGLGLTTPFGLRTEYNTDWSGKSHAIVSDLKTYNISPALSWRVNEYLSLGAGADFQKAEAELSRNILVTGVINADGTIQGAGWGYGFNVGALVAPTKATKIGLSWRSAIKHTVKGDIRYDNRKVFNAGNMNLAGIPADSARAEADLKLPDIITLSGSWNINKMWKLLGTVEWTRWNTVQELRVKFPGTTFKDSVETFKYKNTFFYALGTICQLNPLWNLKFGVAYDMTPTSVPYRSVRIPDEDRTWFSTGAEYKVSDRISVNLSYSYIYIRNTKISLSGSNDRNSPEFTKGNLEGSFKADSHLLGGSFIYRF